MSDEEKTVLRSQVECPNCGDVIASLWRHDFNYCSCGETAIDGGRDYQRVIFTGASPIDRSITVDGRWNNQQSRVLLAALKSIADQRALTDPLWAVDVLVQNNLVDVGLSGNAPEYIGPPVAQRDA